MPSFTVLIKPASGMCSMVCDYCFYCDEAGKRAKESYGYMSEETLKNIIRKTMLNAEGSITFAWQGGEPTLCGVDFFRRAMELQKKYNKKGLKVYNVFQTNGLLIDEEWCRFFAENDILVGISIDGIKEVHDAYRHDKAGAPTYERIVRAAELLDAYKVEYNILTVVHRKTAEHIEEIYREYKRRGWQYQQYIACLEPFGEAHRTVEYALSPEQYGDFLIRLFELWYRDWKRNRAPHIRQFENYISMLLGHAPEACEQRGVCGIQYVVEADGSVYPCDFYVMDEYCIGNFNENKLAEIDAERWNIKFLESAYQLDPACKECPHFYLCRGGCQRHRDFVPDAGYYRNYFCEGFKMFLEKCTDKLAEAAKAAR